MGREGGPLLELSRAFRKKQTCEARLLLPFSPRVVVGYNVSCHVCQDSPSVDSDMARARVLKCRGTLCMLVILTVY